MIHLEKQKVIGAIQSVTHKVSKIIEKGLFVSIEKLQELLENSIEWDLFIYFRIERINYEFSSNGFGKPSVEMYFKWKDLYFKSTFILENPPGKFKNQTPFPQRFDVEEIEESEVYAPKNYEL